jgi:hypothetical protein
MKQTLRVTQNPKGFCFTDSPYAIQIDFTAEHAENAEIFQCFSLRPLRSQR